ncbi:hypothetical protein AW27_013665 [Streptomyces sp. PCS3-D2]|uniref:hypothetical protein n=1 Tax=Streptomyces sp. PCS3-D2 TaxID=1460244 RepID=UPI00272BA18A|nr:hypothetical protein [Streptomyces sp. PCS3-D2]WKV72478.1 hypothetical protein AW27_013665 [Streptomyces sp. PCS3-D2]
MSGVVAGLGQEKGGEWVPADPETAKGPYFKDESGKKVFSLTLPETAADGRIVLPELFTDADLAPGAYQLRLVTPEDVVLILRIEITAPPADAAN